MKVTKKNIIKAVSLATGFTPELDKIEGAYYWCGIESSFFEERCLQYSTLNHPNITIQTFVDDFKDRISKVENEYGESITNIIDNQS